jgi:hypothetical protein
MSLRSAWAPHVVIEQSELDAEHAQRLFGLDDGAPPAWRTASVGVIDLIPLTSIASVV